MKYILTDGVEFTKELFSDTWHGTDGVDAKACEFPERNGVLSGYSQNDGIDYFRKPEKDKEYVSSDGGFTSVKEYYQANNGNDFYTYIDEAGYHHIEFKDGVTGITNYYEDHKEDDDPSDPTITDGKDSILLEKCAESTPVSFLVYGNTRETDGLCEGVGVFQDVGSHSGKYMVPLCVGSQNILDPVKNLDFYYFNSEMHVKHERGSNIYSIKERSSSERPTNDAPIMSPFSASETLKAGPGVYTMVAEILSNNFGGTHWIMHLRSSKDHGSVPYPYTDGISLNGGDNLGMKKHAVTFSENPQGAEASYNDIAQLCFYVQNTKQHDVDVSVKVAMVKGNYEGKEIESDLTYKDPRLSKFYLSEPLFKLGSSCDILDIVNKKVTRSCKRLVFSESTEIIKEDNDFVIDLPGIKSGSAVTFSLYEMSQGGEDESYRIENGKLKIVDSGFSDTADFLLSIIGKSILYELGTPEEEDIETGGKILYFDDGVNFVYMADVRGAIEDNMHLGASNHETKSKIFGDTIAEDEVGMILGIPTYPSKMSVTYNRY